MPLASTGASGKAGWIKEWPAFPSSWVPLASTGASGKAGCVKDWPALPSSWVPFASIGASGKLGCVKDWPSLPSSCVPLATWWVGSACGFGVGCTSFFVPTAITCETGFWTTWSSMTSLTSWPLTIDTLVTRRRLPFTPAVTIRVCPSARFASRLVIVSNGISTKLSSCLVWDFSAEAGLDGWSSASLKYPMYS